MSAKGAFAGVGACHGQRLSGGGPWPHSSSPWKSWTRGRLVCAGFARGSASTLLPEGSSRFGRGDAWWIDHGAAALGQRRGCDDALRQCVGEAEGEEPVWRWWTRERCRRRPGARRGGGCCCG